MSLTQLILGTQKSQRKNAGFSLVRRDREYSLRSWSLRGEADKRKAVPAAAGLLFCALTAWLKRAWPTVLDAKKPAQERWLFTCAERPRFELGDQKNRSQLSRLLHYHSATSPGCPSSVRAFATLGRAKIVKSFLVSRYIPKEFVSCQDRRPSGRFNAFRNSTTL